VRCSALIAEFFVRRLQSICNGSEVASAMEDIEMSRETPGGESNAKAMEMQWKQWANAMKAMRRPRTFESKARPKR
jgi:hypothetical protein